MSQKPVTETDLAKAATLACSYFDGEVKTFTSGCFSKAFGEVTGLHGPLDGMVVQAMLCDRAWLDIQPDGVHWKLNEAVTFLDIL